MKKIIHVLDLFEKYFVLITILGMLIVVCINIVCRSVLSVDFLVGDELSRYLMIFGVFIGIAIGVKTGAHVGIRALVEAFSPNVRKTIDIIQTILTTVVYGACAVISFETALHFLKVHQLSTMMRIPMGIIYFVLPLGFLLSVIHSIENIFKLIKNPPALTEREKAERGEVEITQ